MSKQRKEKLNPDKRKKKGEIGARVERDKKGTVRGRVRYFFRGKKKEGLTYAKEEEKGCSGTPCKPRKKKRKGPDGRNRQGDDLSYHRDGRGNSISRSPQKKTERR